MRTKIPRVYYQLRNHFNQMPVGYPRTVSKVEVRLLNEFFSEIEAQIALGMTYHFENSEIIFRRLKKYNISREEIENYLEQMASKSILKKTNSSGEKLFALLPFAIGLYESKSSTLTPEFNHDALRYFNPAFGLSLAFNPISQFRQIPIEQSIIPQLNIATYDQLANIIHQAKDHIAVMNCVCRAGTLITAKSCQKTTRLETCLVFNDYADFIIRCGNGRAITENEALDIAKQSEQDGLILQPENAQNPNWFCACCGDCCLLLKLLKTLPRPVEFASTNFYAVQNPTLCTGCEICKNRCQMDAIYMAINKNSQKSKISHIDPWRCIGCGLCISTCPQNAIQLRMKSELMIPPINSQYLMDKLAESKRNIWQKSLLLMHLGILWIKKGIKSIFH